MLQAGLLLQKVRWFLWGLTCPFRGLVHSLVRGLVGAAARFRADVSCLWGLTWSAHRSLRSSVSRCKRPVNTFHGSFRVFRERKVVIGHLALTLLALLYWYKSTNTDAARMSSLSLFPFPLCYMFITHTHTLIHLYIDRRLVGCWLEYGLYYTRTLPLSHAHI